MKFLLYVNFFSVEWSLKDFLHFFSLQQKSPKGNLEWMQESYIPLLSGNFLFHGTWKERKLNVVYFGGKTGYQIFSASQPRVGFNLNKFTPGSEFTQSFDMRASIENKLKNFKNLGKYNVNEIAHCLVWNAKWSVKLNYSSSCSVFKGVRKLTMIW